MNVAGILFVLAVFVLAFVVPVVIFSLPRSRAFHLAGVAGIIFLAEVLYYFALSQGGN